ncbi:hypothetical protein [Spirosoma endbachense]|uniref:Uncharacterized protein n=1 Tax=Spirosoma endbachense TaxID=2666025 RepID=A0A6P1VU33_9BACT|nr:hypothetical protein [Spirosoma endbachense]QHV96593.1 hypothetical protein GJR95_16935 [Spirosoma endbachense]
MNLLKQRNMYKTDLPVNFQSWNEFYDELVRLGQIQPTIDIIQIRVFNTSSASLASFNNDRSFTQYLTYERTYIDQMCLAELRRARADSSHRTFTIDELTELIRLVSNQASRLKHWDLLVKLNEELLAQQVRKKNQHSYRTVSGHESKSD